MLDGYEFTVRVLCADDPEGEDLCASCEHVVPDVVPVCQADAVKLLADEYAEYGDTRLLDILARLRVESCGRYERSEP